MNICLLCYRGKPNCGGQGVYIYYLSRELARLGHQVHVMSGPPYPVVERGITLHRLPSLNLYESKRRFPYDFPKRPTPLNLYEYGDVALGGFPEPFTFSARAFMKLRELQPTVKFDVVHDNQGLGYGLLWIKHLLKIPVVATIHHPVTVDRDLDIASAKSLYWKLRLKRWYSITRMQGYVARRMDRIVSVSNAAAEDTSHAFGVRKERTRVVHNGTDETLFKPDSSIPKEPHSLITVNSADSPMKGVSYLLEALSIVRNGIQPKLTIVGSAIPGGKSETIIRKHGLEDLVKFTGRINDRELVARYSASEIAVVPSLYEGFGLPAAEAMACGLPVIVSQAGALPEVIGTDSQTGLSVPPADPAALASAIKHLLTHEQLRRKMGEAGRKRVETH
ncbi:MAG: glycosyltransferase family 4 protein, partial [Chloroflexi bacterium]|nr:glycosyltransferase family 4 protein [Chloroflexota bacterium]